MQKILRGLKIVISFAVLAVMRLSILTFFVWSAGAVCYLNYLPYVLRVILCAVYVISGIGLLLRAAYLKRANRRGDRIGNKFRFTNTFGILALSVLIVWLLTQIIRPSNNRDWATEQSQLPSVEIESDTVTVNNFRHNVYRSESDFDVHYGQQQLRLSEIEDVWYFVQKFSAIEGLAHTFVSFGYQPQDGGEKKYICVSVEVRRETEEAYSPWAGAFRNYEINYVIGDERDLVLVRTVHRPQDRVYMFKTNATSQQAQKMFLSVVGRVNRLQDHPEFYNTFLNNCTNSLAVHTREIAPFNWLDLRVVFPGYSHAVCFELGVIGDPKKNETLAGLSARSRIDEVAKSADQGPSFSSQIRQR